MFGKRVKRLSRVNSTKGDFEKKQPNRIPKCISSLLRSHRSISTSTAPIFCFPKMLKPKSPSSHFLKLRWGLACQLEMMMLLQQCWKVDKMTFFLQFAAMHQTFHKLTKNLEWKFKTFLRKNQLCKLQKFCKNVPLTEHLLSQKFVFRYKLKRVSLGSSWVNFLVTCCPSRWSNFERRWRISLTLLCSLLFRSWISREGFLCYTKKVRWVGGKTFIKQLLLAVVSSEDE